MIGLVFVLEEMDKVNPLLSTVFMEEGMKAIDRLSTETHVCTCTCPFCVSSAILIVKM